MVGTTLSTERSAAGRDGPPPALQGTRCGYLPLLPCGALFPQVIGRKKNYEGLPLAFYYKVLHKVGLFGRVVSRAG